MLRAFALGSTLMFLAFSASPGEAACAAFVCKHPSCRYQIISSTGVRLVDLIGGERRILTGLGFDAAYCDWDGGCVTPRRGIHSLGAC